MAAGAPGGSAGGSDPTAASLNVPKSLTDEHTQGHGLLGGSWGQQLGGTQSRRRESSCRPRPRDKDTDRFTGHGAWWQQRGDPAPRSPTHLILALGVHQAGLQHVQGLAQDSGTSPLGQWESVTNGPARQRVWVPLSPSQVCSEEPLAWTPSRCPKGCRTRSQGGTLGTTLPGHQVTRELSQPQQPEGDVPQMRPAPPASEPRPHPRALSPQGGQEPPRAPRRHSPR